MKYLILLNLCLLSYVGCANKHNRQNDTTNKIMIRPIKYSRYRIVVNYWVKILFRTTVPRSIQT